MAYLFWVHALSPITLANMKSIHAPAYRALLTWLRKSRQAKGLNMRDAAAKLGVPHTWISKIETGERRLDVAEYVRLCRVLGADPHAGIDVVQEHGRSPKAVVALPVAATKPRQRYRTRK